jgi:hypothetical protein
MRTVECPQCSKQLKAPDEAIGKKVQCTGCSHTFVLQDQSVERPDRSVRNAKDSYKRTIRIPFVVVLLLAGAGTLAGGIVVWTLAPSNGASTVTKANAPRLPGPTMIQPAKPVVSKIKAPAKAPAEQIPAEEQIESVIGSALRDTSTTEGKQGEFDRTILRAACDHLRAMRKGVNDRSTTTSQLAKAMKTLKIVEKSIEGATSNHDRTEEAAREAAKRINDAADADALALLDVDARARVREIAKNIAGKLALDPVDPYFLVKCGVMREWTTDYFANRLTKGELAALVTLGDDPTKGTSGAFNAARDRAIRDVNREITDGSPDTLTYALDQVRPELDASWAALRRSEVDFRSRKAALEELLAVERVYIVHIAERLSASGQLSDIEAAWLRKKGFGEKMTRETLRVVK